MNNQQISRVQVYSPRSYSRALQFRVFVAKYPPIDYCDAIISSGMGIVSQSMPPQRRICGSSSQFQRIQVRLRLSRKTISWGRKPSLRPKSAFWRGFSSPSLLQKENAISPLLSKLQAFFKFAKFDRHFLIAGRGEQEEVACLRLFPTLGCRTLSLLDNDCFPLGAGAAASVSRGLSVCKVSLSAKEYSILGISGSEMHGLGSALSQYWWNSKAAAVLLRQFYMMDSQIAGYTCSTASMLFWISLPIAVNSSASCQIASLVNLSSASMAARWLRMALQLRYFCTSSTSSIYLKQAVTCSSILPKCVQDSRSSSSLSPYLRPNSYKCQESSPKKPYIYCCRGVLNGDFMTGLAEVGVVVVANLMMLCPLLASMMEHFSQQ